MKPVLCFVFIVTIVIKGLVTVNWSLKFEELNKMHCGIV